MLFTIKEGGTIRQPSIIGLWQRYVPWSAVCLLLARIEDSKCIKFKIIIMISTIVFRIHSKMHPFWLQWLKRAPSSTSVLRAHFLSSLSSSMKLEVAQCLVGITFNTCDLPARINISWDLKHYDTKDTKYVEKDRREPDKKMIIPIIYCCIDTSSNVAASCCRNSGVWIPDIEPKLYSVEITTAFHF